MSDCTDLSQAGPPPKYRFFNQPIEQITGYDTGLPQFLMHRGGGGLEWITVDKHPIVIEVNVETGEEGEELVREKQYFWVIKNCEDPEKEPIIALTECEEESEE
jgi:hypothetical protein